MTSTRKNQTSKKRRPSTVLPSPSASSRKRNTGPQVNVTNEIQDDSFKRGFRNIPAFLSKLYSMVDDDNTELIYWSEDGTSFIVEEQEAFSKTILPRYFKHNTFSSFVRQLNMYDFHKIPHVRQGVLVSDGEREHWEFQHPYFQRGKQDILHLVTRKKIRSTNANTSTTVDNSTSPPNVAATAAAISAAISAAVPPTSSPQSVLPLQQLVEGSLPSIPSSTTATAVTEAMKAQSALNLVPDFDRNDIIGYDGRLDHIRLGSLVKDISSIRQHQHAITTDLQHLHNDNEVLWREILLAREKHQRHQQVIERILLFLTTIFSNDSQLDIMKNPRFMLGENNEFISPSLDAVQFTGITRGLQNDLLKSNLELHNNNNNNNNNKVGNTTKPATGSTDTPPGSGHVPPTSTASNQASHGQQDKVKMGMYGKATLDALQLLNSLKSDAYSFCHSTPSPISSPHGLSLAMNSFLHRYSSDQYAATSPSTASSASPSIFSSPSSSTSSPSSSRLSNTFTSQQLQQQQQQQQQQQHPHSINQLQQPQPQQIPLESLVGDNLAYLNQKGLNENNNNDHLHYNNNSAPSSSPLPSPSSFTMNAQQNNNNNYNNNNSTNSNNNSNSSCSNKLSFGGSEVNRIAGFSTSLNNATRSAEAISQDIDDLQISIETLAATMGLDVNMNDTFDGYISQFSDNYSDMISSATRNDRIQLFKLAGGSHIPNKYDDSLPESSSSAMSRSMGSSQPSPNDNNNSDYSCGKNSNNNNKKY